MRVNVAIVGAGMSGLSCASHLLSADTSNRFVVSIFERSGDVGGRMATVRKGDNAFDSGAQFFTVRSAEFQSVVDEWLAANVVDVWCHGFNGDGYPRYKGTKGMKSICRYMFDGLQDRVTLSMHTNVDVDELAEQRQQSDGDAVGYVVDTSPCDMVTYGKTLSVHAVMGDASNFAVPSSAGAMQRPSQWPNIHFICDEKKKGNAKSQWLTIHGTTEFSENHWDADDQQVMVNLLPLDVRKHVVSYSVKRWSKAIPLTVLPTRFHREGNLIRCGDAFKQLGIEGAFLSGKAAAEEIIRLIE